MRVVALLLKTGTVLGLLVGLAMLAVGDYVYRTGTAV